MIDNIYNGMGITIIKADLYFPLEEQKPVNNPKLIIVHRNNRDNESIYELEERQQNKSGFKYHYYVRKDGTIIAGRMEYMASNHCKGHSNDSIAICLEGRYDEEVNKKQFSYLQRLIQDIQSRRGMMTVYAHNELDKDVLCPGDKKLFPINLLRSNLQICGHPGDLPECEYKRRIESDPHRWNPLP